MKRIPSEIIGEVNKCIYCGKENNLTDEHIVPFGLNGPWILKKASCESCAEITSEFEFDVLRKTLEIPRTALNLPTRRPHLRSNKFTLSVKKAGNEKTTSITLDKYLTILFLPLYKLPAYIDGREYSKGVDICGISSVLIKNIRLQYLKKKYKVKDIKVQQTWYGNSFERLLVKIAYGFSIAYYGIEKLKKVYIVPTILGEKDDVGRWVGCATDTVLSVGKYLHQVQLDEYKGDIIVRIKLFSLFNVPEYIVVVGPIPKPT